MSKGDDTREQILETAVELASTVGLEGVTIGQLARSMSLSKSGLFAHFRSKERLQIAILESAAAQFADQVVRPAVRQPRGEPRVVALFENWLAWAAGMGLPGGCLFVSASAEFDDRPGAVRERLVARQREWTDALARAVAIAQAEGHFRTDVEPAQIAFEAYGIMLGAHHAHRLMGDARALERARTAFSALLARVRL